VLAGPARSGAYTIVWRRPVSWSAGHGHVAGGGAWSAGVGRVVARYSDELRHAAIAAVVAHEREAIRNQEARYRGMHSTTVGTRRHGDAVRAVAARFHVRPDTLRQWIRHDGTHSAGSSFPPAAANQVPDHVDQLIRQLLRAHPSTLFATHGLVPARHTPALAGSPNLTADVSIAASDLFVALDHDYSTVVARIPIHHMYGAIHRLRFDAITDVIAAVAYAAWADADCVLYLPLAAELNRPRTRVPARRWHGFTNSVLHLIDRVVSELAVPPRSLILLRTDTPHVAERIGVAVDEHSHRLAALRNLERVGRRTGPGRLSIDLSLVVGYLPEVIDDVAGRHGKSHVVVVESLRTARAVAVARFIAADAGHRVDYLAHLPAPSLDGRQVMSAAPAEHALKLHDAADTNRGKLAAASGPARTHWERMWQMHAALLAGGADAGLPAMADHYRQLTARPDTFRR
jgi:transposase-like protein